MSGAQAFSAAADADPASQQQPTPPQLENPKEDDLVTADSAPDIDGVGPFTDEVSGYRVISLLY